MSRLMLTSTAALAACLASCGNNAPDIPEDLLDAIEASGSNGNGDDYPTENIGTTEGKIAQNICFPRAWTNPKEQGYDPAAFDEVCFSDFYDPDDEKGIELILVNTGAVWCSACQIEWGGSGTQPSLIEQAALRRDRGFRVIGSIFQDAARDPATEVHAVAWAEKFDVDLPFALDDTFLMGAFANADIQPYNMIIDAKTMEILLQVEGDQPLVIWNFVDAELDKREAGE